MKLGWKKRNCSERASVVGFPISNNQAIINLVGFTRLIHLYDFPQAIPACSLDVVGLELREYGGVLEEQLSETVTHVLFDKRSV